MEDKILNDEQLKDAVGGQVTYNFYDEGSVRFHHYLQERVSMKRSNQTFVYGTITDRGIYKKDTHEYYACYYVDLDNVLGDGWFYDESGIKFANRISCPDKKGL